MTRVDFRPMGGRSGYVWLAATALGVLAVSGWYAVTDPANRPYTLSGPLLIAGAVFLIVRCTQWLEVTDDDTVLVQRRAFRTVRVGLAGADRVFLRGNGAGTAQVVARGGGRTAFAGMQIASVYSQGYQPAEVVEALVRGIERNRSKAARETAELLRRQLEHVRAGRPPATAPLVVFTGDRTGVAGAVGAAGAAGGLSDLP